MVDACSVSPSYSWLKCESYKVFYTASQSGELDSFYRYRTWLINLADKRILVFGKEYDFIMCIFSLPYVSTATHRCLSFNGYI